MNGGWEALRVVFRADSPIHIGWHDLGVIQRTRYYIPARAVWGAMVAGYAARNRGGGVPEIYHSAQERLGSCFRSTCFFPKCGVDGDPMRPRYLDEETDRGRHGLYYGGLPPAQFEARWIASQTSTAIEASCLAAEDRALHESEYISRVARPAKGDYSAGFENRQLYFEGYVLFREPLKAPAIKDALDVCTVGADRGYGWGRLKLVPRDEAKPDIFGFALDGEVGGNPALKPATAPFYLPAHLHVDRTEERGLAGDLEVLSGRDWSARGGAGQQLVQARLCWAPGTCGSGDPSKWRFALGPEGMWTLA
jgi:hypothetical protein